jgi:hypothetical protein
MLKSREPELTTVDVNRLVGGRLLIMTRRAA